MYEGWWKFFRTWQQHELSKDANANLVFCHLCSSASITETENRRYGHKLKAGETDVTLKQLCERTELTSDQARQALKRLEKYGTIERHHVGGRVPAITKLVNWHLYAGAGDDAPVKPQLNPKQTPVKPQHLKKVKKVKKVKNKSAREAHAIPDDLAAYRTDIEGWLDYKRERGQAYKERGLAQLWARCRELGNGLPGAVRHSISNNYAGLFADKSAGTAKGRSFESAERTRSKWDEFDKSQKG